MSTAKSQRILRFSNVVVKGFGRLFVSPTRLHLLQCLAVFLGLPKGLTHYTNVRVMRFPLVPPLERGLPRLLTLSKDCKSCLALRFTRFTVKLFPALATGSICPYYEGWLSRPHSNPLAQCRTFQGLFHHIPLYPTAITHKEELIPLPNQAPLFIAPLCRIIATRVCRSSCLRLSILC